jgi:hypothetical protein
MGQFLKKRTCPTPVGSNQFRENDEGLPHPPPFSKGILETKVSLFRRDVLKFKSRSLLDVSAAEMT